jgi:type IV pilus assembly protein PilW
MSTIKKSLTIKPFSGEQGFTLIELIVAMLMVSVAMGAIFAISISAQRSYTHQRELAHMQQNLRAAMYLIKNDIRNTGRNALMNDAVGITNVSRFNPDADDPAGYPGITLTSLWDTDAPPDGIADDAQRTIAYRVFDSDGDGRRELRRWDSLSAAPAWDLVFDGIEDIGFAYAYDTDNDLNMERTAVAVGAGPIIWAINTDNVVGLDTNADNVPDGDINALDDTDGDGDIDNADGGLGTQIPLSDIRAVRIWLLARSRTAFPGFTDNSIYTLGHKVLDMSAAANANRNNFRHKLLVGAVAMNNHERKP